MRPVIVQRFCFAREAARQAGLDLVDCGQPRGERRVYSLSMPDGSKYETQRLDAIERRIEKITQPKGTT